jgi:hypothetical protein
MEGTVETSYFLSLQKETLGLITSEMTTMNTFFFVEEDEFKVVKSSRNFDNGVNYSTGIQIVLDKIL